MRSQHLNRCPYTRCTLGGFERVEHELPDNSLSIVSLLEHIWDHYLNLVLPNRQIRRSNSNLAANNLCNVDEKEDANDKKTALHKKNIQTVPNRQSSYHAWLVTMWSLLSYSLLHCRHVTVIIYKIDIKTPTILFTIII
jgi:predicted nucleotidyltransferase